MKISSLQDKIHCVDEEAHRSLRSSDSAVRALSNEVRFLKSSLEQVTERERRVCSFVSFSLFLRFSFSFLVIRFSFVNWSNGRT